MNKDLVDRLIEDWRRERPDLDASPMAAVGRIIHAGRILEARADKAVKPYGLIYTDLDVLATLRRAGAPFRLTPTDLRSSVLLTSGAMTAALARLARLRLITRAQGKDDRRVRWVTLTASGKSIVDRAIGARFAEAEAALCGLAPGARTDLARALKTLIASIAAAP